MDRNHSRLIIFLLAGILVVLLFGRGAVLCVIKGVLWVAVAIFVIGLLVALFLWAKK
jgi:uncharacterized membrane protein